MRSSWKVTIPVVVLNALIQPLLLIADPTPALTWAIWPLAVISLLVLVASVILIVAAISLQSTGEFTWADLLARLKSRIIPMLAYTIGWLLLLLLAFSLWILPGLVVLAMTPYLLIAVVEGSGNPIRSNFRAIRTGIPRWILLLVASAILIGLSWVGSALLAFFFPQLLGGLLTWLIFGFIGAFVVKLWFRGWLKSSVVPAF